MHVGVIGAGVVGLACAAHLQRRGVQVTLVDPAEPGAGCSYGNAGCLSRASVVPVGLPGLWKSVPGYLMDPAGPFRIDWRYAHRIAPWLLALQRSSSLQRVNAIADALHPLLDPTVTRWRELAQWAGASRLIHQDGYAFVYASRDAFERDALGRHLRQVRGVKIEVLTGGAIREFDPALSPKLTHMTLLPEQGHVSDPAGLSAALAARLRAGGATFMASVATDFRLEGDRVDAIVTSGGNVAVDAVLLAAGARSRDLARRLGARVPLDTERGYHVMLPTPATPVRVPVCSGEGKFFLTPMEGGLRVAGTVELAGLTRGPDPRRAQLLAAGAARLVPQLEGSPISSSWLGHRPSLPDSLPVMGRSPQLANAYFCFGHGHVGLTAAPMSGVAMAELIHVGSSGFDLTPYSASRFS